MDDNADAKRILLASPPANWRRQLGRPRITWLSTFQQDLKQHHLTLREAIDLAQNRPLWRMMSTYGATQSWVACQKRRRRRTQCIHTSIPYSRDANTNIRTPPGGSSPPPESGLKPLLRNSWYTRCVKISTLNSHRVYHHPQTNITQIRPNPSRHANKTRGQSNLTKSASRGAHSPVRGHPRGRNLYHWIPVVGFPITVP